APPTTGAPLLSLHAALPISQAPISTRSVLACRGDRLRSPLSPVPRPCTDRLRPRAVHRAAVPPHPAPTRADRREAVPGDGREARSEEHTSELQSRFDLVCRL